jgi:beta-mannosidase
VRTQAVRQARLAVDELGHHPSVAIWCGHNSPVPISIDPDAVATAANRRRLAVRSVAAQELPTYNRTILDRSIARTLRRNDPSRPVVPHSGVLPNLPRLDGTDSHLYLGWYGGEEWQLPALAAAMPRLVRFVGEFGAQSVPTDADFVDPAAWPDLDWDELGERYGAQHGVFERYVPPGDHPTFESWAEATRQYQANLVFFGIESLRRLKYRPTGGFAVFSFADSAPGITWSVLSAARVPKPAYRALAAACAPVIAVADRLPHHVHPGDALAVQVHVVSDLRRDLTGVRVVATWRWDGGEVVEGFEGDVPADGVVRVGEAHVVAPEEDGLLELELELRYDDVVTTRRDRTVVLGGPHEH